MGTLSWICLFLAIGFAVYSILTFVRDRDTQPTVVSTAPWGLIIATLRDTFIITMLYVSEGLLWRFSTFQQASETLPAQVWLYAPVIDPILSLLVLLLIFAIATLRVFALGRWLREQAATEH